MAGQQLADDPAVLFAGAGEMAARMRELDWAKTALGPIRDWPLSLRTCVRVILTSRQPMFVWWGESLINLYNDAYKSILGGKHPEVLGQPASVVWREIWDQVGPRATFAMRVNEGTYDEALPLIMERNGYPEETFYTFSYSPVPNDQGGAGGILCANTDDTQRIISERQLKLLRVLSAETTNARNALDVCTRACRAIGGVERDLPFTLMYLADPDKRILNAVGAAGLESYPQQIDTATDASVPWAEVLSGQQIASVADPVRLLGALPNGPWDKPPSQVVCAPIAGEAGRSGVLIAGLNPYRLFDEGYRGFIRLVASQLSASIANADAYELERQRAEALAELDRAKTAFFSNVSHEFRTPLTLMLGPLEDAVSSPERQLSGANLETAHRNALRLLRLVNALLDFSRIEAGRADANYEPTDLALLTADLSSAFRSAIERAGLRFEVDLPKLAEPFFIDHDMWEKIVLNLLSNALKFTFDGAISVRLREVGGHAELEVSDTGVGIPTEELGNVFKRFHRIQGSRSRTHEGSGIGLALVNELVRLHGGTIEVASELSAGTTFTLRIPRGSAHLPAARIGSKRSLSSTAVGARPFIEEAERWLPGAAPESAAVPAELAAPGPAASVQRAKILLADDNADMREYVTRLLRARFEVKAVSDGREALEAALAEPPDLVLTDVMMPQLDGFGLLKALRADARTKHLPIIMLSARAGEEAQVVGFEAGADDYLVKPFSARELLARVTARLQIARLQQAAESERARLYAIFMQAPVPVAVLLGPELRFEVANAAYCEMVSKEGVVGLTMRDAFPELTDHPAVDVLARVAASGEPFVASEMKVPLERAGVLRDSYFNLSVQPLRGLPTGIESGVVVVATEVTEQVLARRRVDALRATAEQASRAKDEFLSTLSHELRTPLNAIVGWSTLLRQGTLPSDRAAQALETVERNALVQARLIDDMLDLARIEQGKLVLSVGPVEMVRVVDAAIEAVRPAADAKGVRLQPVLDSHATIVGDPDRLQQVAWNLLSNAIKFTPKGGRVQTRLRRAHSYVELVVADDGQGIDPDFLPFVFDRFRQADPSFTRRAGGLGLGLAIVRSLVELHGGTVQASSDGPGRGATFQVRLPMAPLRADNAPKELREDANIVPKATFECPKELEGTRVLVCDDEHETRELLRYLIEQCGAHVDTASGAAEALEYLARERYDVLVCDIGMPDMDGYTLIGRIRSLPPERNGRIRAVALTAYARAEDRTKALRSGFTMHLAKPVEPSELLAVLAAVVGRAN